MWRRYGSWKQRDFPVERRLLKHAFRDRLVLGIDLGWGDGLRWMARARSIQFPAGSETSRTPKEQMPKDGDAGAAKAERVAPACGLAQTK